MSEKVWTNSGRVFQNDSKSSERSADMRGDGEVTCPHCKRRVSFFMDLWNKASGKGPWASLSFKVKDKQPPAGPETPPQSSVKPFSETLDFGHSGGPAKRTKDAFDDDIPF